ncbi:hypothetical protein Tco_0444530 [Tanacetum coccineum]
MNLASSSRDIDSEEFMNVFMRIGFGSTIKLVSFDKRQVVTFNSKFICSFRNSDSGTRSRGDNTVGSPHGLSSLDRKCGAQMALSLGDPGSFLIPCTFANSVECLALADLGASINLMPYSLYTSLFMNTLKPTRMNFVILKMEEDNKVPLILGRPFLHIADAIIKVKNKELILGVGDDSITFLIDKAMQHSHSNDDTCFRIDVIDEVTEEEIDA